MQAGKDTDVSVATSEVKANINRLQLKLAKIEKLVGSGQEVSVDELKALNQALAQAHDMGAAW